MFAFALDVSSLTVAQIVIGFIFSAGGISSIIALLKLRPEASSAAVQQAQGAMETMAGLNEYMKSELDGCRQDVELLQAKIKSQESVIEKLSQMLHGVEIMGQQPPTDEERT